MMSKPTMAVTLDEYEAWHKIDKQRITKLVRRLEAAERALSVAILAKQGAEQQASAAHQKTYKEALLKNTPEREQWKQRAIKAEATITVLSMALEKLARLGNEPHLGNSVGNVIAQQALLKQEQE